ncbi:MAG: alpha/beta hydrolase [Mesorhizobium sp.]
MSHRLGAHTLAKTAVIRELPSPTGPIVYRIWGRTRHKTLVLVHGGSGSWIHWAPVIPLLTRKVRVVAVDLPGFGDSAHGSIRNLDEIVDGLVAVIECEMRNLTEIAAFSFGAVCAAEALRKMDWPVDLHAVAPAGFGPSALKPGALKSWSTIAELELRLLVHKQNLESSMLSNAAFATPSVVSAYASAVERARFDTRECSFSHLFEIALPKMRLASVIWGRADAFVGADLDRRRKLIKDVHPGARQETIENCGHWLQLEQPAKLSRWIAPE